MAPVTTIAYIKALAPPSLPFSQAGYNLTMFESAVEHIIHGEERARSISSDHSLSPHLSPLNAPATKLSPLPGPPAGSPPSPATYYLPSKPSVSPPIPPPIPPPDADAASALPADTTADTPTDTPTDTPVDIPTDIEPPRPSLQRRGSSSADKGLLAPPDIEVAPGTQERRSGYGPGSPDGKGGGAPSFQRRRCACVCIW